LISTVGRSVGRLVGVDGWMGDSWLDVRRTVGWSVVWRQLVGRTVGCSVGWTVASSEAVTATAGDGSDRRSFFWGQNFLRIVRNEIIT